MSDSPQIKIYTIANNFWKVSLREEHKTNWDKIKVFTIDKKAWKFLEWKLKLS